MFVFMADRGGAGLLVCLRTDADIRLLLAFCFEAEFDESTHRFRPRDPLFRRPFKNSGLRVCGQSQLEDGPIPAAWRPTSSSRRFSLLRPCHAASPDNTRPSLFIKPSLRESHL